MDREVLISKFPVSSIQLHALFVSMFLNIICFCSTLCTTHLNQWHGTFLLQFPHICLEIFNYVVVHKIWNRRSGVNFNLLDRIVLSTCLWKLYLILHLLLLKWIHGISRPPLPFKGIPIRLLAALVFNFFLMFKWSILLRHKEF